jgi:RNA 2',3'-cyclic 3'-phosphodiesterase
MRLFLGIDIPDDIRQRITDFVECVRSHAPDARWVKPETYHITLKFIGEFKPERLDDLKTTLSTVAAPAIDISFRGCGFFSPRSPKAFWIGVHANETLPSLASAVQDACAKLGIATEDHAYTPHLTLARTGSGRPQGSPRDRNKPVMWNLRDEVQRMPPPDFGTMTAQEFFLFESKLSPKGAQYTKIAGFQLGSAGTCPERSRRVSPAKEI